MKILLMILMLAVTGSVYAQDKPAAAPAAIEAHTPTIAEGEALRIQLLATKRALLISQFAELKRQFEDQSKDMDSKFQTLSKELLDAIDAEYKKHNLSRDEFSFDIETGKFSPVTKDPPAK